MHVRHALLCSACLLVAACPPARAGEGPPPVKMWMDDMVIPTYRTGEPEKNPIFFDGRSYQGAKGPIYPYPLYDKLTDIKEDKTYKAIHLENQYVEFTMLPELGGRIFSGRDKTNGYDFIYRQHVIKPALIGMIGAWISGGVEWNIPHHHRASSFLPVDYRMVENPDGSKSVWFGEIERRHRMKWLVGLTLWPDRSYLKITTKLFNRTPFAHTMLDFMNIAVHANPQYQVLFPPGTQYGTQHGKSEFTTWPIGSGRYGGIDRTGVDLSWWKDLPTPVSIFAWNYEDDFFGGYDHGKQAGIAIIGDHHVAPGKKFFAWGNGPQGRMWDKILTDTDGPYLELMAGAYSDNQPDYSWIQPGEVKVVEQCIYPIRQLGGLTVANRDAAIHMEEIKGENGPVTRIRINATEEIRNGQLIASDGPSFDDSIAASNGVNTSFLSPGAGRTVLQERVTINPRQAYIREVSRHDGICELSLSSAGRRLIHYRATKQHAQPKPKPVQPPLPPKDVKSNEELYLAGLRLEQFHSPALEPYPYYEEALRRDPGDYRANLALGILYCKRGMYDHAIKRLTAATERATRNHTSAKDAEAFYYLGVALRGKHGADDLHRRADDAFEKAAWNAAWVGPANHALAEMACARDEIARALTFVDRSIAANALNVKALDLKISLLRVLIRYQEAESLVDEVCGIDPLDYRSANERYLMRSSKAASIDPFEEPRGVNIWLGAAKEVPEAALKDFTGLMRSEAESYIELAVDYGNCGLYKDAVRTLQRLVDLSADKDRIHPMVYYYLSYFGAGGRRAVSEPDPFDAHGWKAGLVSPDYCFPFRLESIDVLRWAMPRNPSHGRDPYYLGNLLYDLQPKAAIEAWEKSRQLDDKVPTVHRNLALAYARVEHDLPKAIASMETAIACDAKDPKLFAELDTLYEAANTDPQKRLAILEKNHETVAQRDDGLLREIQLHILLGNYDRAIALMENRHFRLWEGETGVHDVYADAHLLRGRRSLKAKQYAEARKDFEAAQEYPDRFAEARPERGGKLAEAQYLLGLVHEAEGEADKAKTYFEQAAQDVDQPSPASYYQALACRKLGREDKATELFDSLIRFGKERLQAASELDFFAKFGTRQSPAAQKARAHYLIGLGHLGKGQRAEAKTEFEAALRENIAHLGAKTILAETQ